MLTVGDTNDIKFGITFSFDAVGTPLKDTEPYKLSLTTGAIDVGLYVSPKLTNPYEILVELVIDTAPFKSHTPCDNVIELIVNKFVVVGTVGNE